MTENIIVYQNSRSPWTSEYTDIEFFRFISEIVSGSNLEGIHERYQAVLDILIKKKCSLSEAMRRFGIPHNTLRDYVSICELKIIDIERYKKVVEAEWQRSGKVSVKSIKTCCRVALSEYRVQAKH